MQEVTVLLQPSVSGLGAPPSVIHAAKSQTLSVFPSQTIHIYSAHMACRSVTFLKTHQVREAQFPVSKDSSCNLLTRTSAIDSHAAASFFKFLFFFFTRSHFCCITLNVPSAHRKGHGDTGAGPETRSWCMCEKQQQPQRQLDTWTSC